MADNQEESIADYARQEILRTMYASVSRMNKHIFEDNPEAALSEKGLQRNLRGNFCKIRDRRKPD
jgi:hypothetical protein